MAVRNLLVAGVLTLAAVSSTLCPNLLLNSCDAVPLPLRNTSSHQANKARGGSLVVTTTSLPSGSVGASYSATLTASGGKTPYTWSLVQNQLPPGLALDTKSGNISGTPTEPADFTFTVAVMDARGATASATLTISVVSSQSTVAANPTSLSFSNVTVGTSATQNLAITVSGSANVTFSQVTVSGAGFSATSPSLPLTLSPNQSMSLGVTFAPASTGNVVGNISVVSDATNSPLSVSLSGAAVAAHSVDLSWTASTSTVVGYNVYRSSQSAGPYTKLDSSLITGTSFADGTVQAGQTYYYVTTAVDSSNVESAFSNQVSAVIPTP
jgi:Putative Ig domain/Cep192 domain 4